jgi:type 1 glutamine amidotransferase
MTPLTQNEQNAHVFASVVGRAQEASIPSAASLTPPPPQSRYEREAFLSVVTKAQEGVHTVGSLGAMAYRDSGGKATSTRNKFKVKPLLIDYLVDVQNVARKTLTAIEFAYFYSTYFVKYTPVDEVSMFDSADQEIRRKLGEAFIQFEIYPFNVYMNHADQDVRKRFENN